MSNNQNQFIAFEINGADHLEISGNTIAGTINGVLKSNSKIDRLIVTDNTILNTSEIEVLQSLVEAVKTETTIPESIKDELLNAIKSLENIKNEQDKASTFKKIADISEKLIHLGSSAVAISPIILTLISKLSL